MSRKGLFCVQCALRNRTNYVEVRKKGTPWLLPNPVRRTSRYYSHATGDSVTLDDGDRVAIGNDDKAIDFAKKHLKQMAPIKAVKRIKRKPIAVSANQRLSVNSQERAVPSSRVSRMLNYGGLAASLSIGALSDSLQKQLGLKDDTDNSLLGGTSFLSEANAEKIVKTLCKVRGAALKFGQMISIQDNTMIPPQLQQIFERVRSSADFMPGWQLETVLVKELGQNWRDNVASFEDKPFAAASIGQVHQAVTKDGKTVAMKIQYPGVAESIDSDLDTIMSILKFASVIPEGLFAEDAIDVARKELADEVDYVREAKYTNRFRELVADDPTLYIPEIVPELSAKRVITSELITGIPVDKAAELDQHTRNKIASSILRLCLRELFEFRLMQTDPNFANFFYNQETDQICLLDFGATREYNKKFIDKYIRVIHSASIGDRLTVEKYSKELGFLTGYESKVMVNAHVDAVMILGEPFGSEEAFDFGAQDITHRIQQLIPVMLKHRLKPPPQETYSLHRKMSGAFLLCAKLKAKIKCRSIFLDSWESYDFPSSA